MGAEGHPISFQNITGLPVKPDGIAKLDGISAFLGKHFTEHIQHRVGKWKNKEDDEGGLCRALHPFIEQPDMDDVKAGLDGKDKSSRGDIVPPRQGAMLR
jgi:hypothetical protein